MRGNVKRILFWFGSGISLPSGYPGTDQILKHIFDFNPGDELETCKVRRGKFFLHLLRNYVRPYFFRRRVGLLYNYEDLYELAERLAGSGLRKRASAEMAALTQLLCQTLRELGVTTEDSEDEEWSPSDVQMRRAMRMDYRWIFVELGKAFSTETRQEILGRDYYMSDDDDLAGLAADAADVILAALVDLLESCSDYKPQGLELFRQALEDQSIEGVDVITTNYDTLLEQVSSETGIKWFDGVNVDENHVPTFLWDEMLRSTGRLRIIKLHGSMNWLYSSQSEGRVHTPLLLVGRELKAEFHSGPFWGTLNFSGMQILNQHDTVVMCGCGWSDDTVISHLQYWQRIPGRRILLLHPDPYDLYRAQGFRAGLYYRNIYDSADDRLVPVRKWLKDISWKELKSLVWRSR